MPEPSEASTSRASSGVARQHVDSKKEQGGKRRKAGGTGKKGKKFMEDKVCLSSAPPLGAVAENQAGLMDLISSVTNTQSAKVDAKLIKSRARLLPPSKDNADGVAGGSTRADLGEEKKREKERRRAEKGLALVCLCFLMLWCFGRGGGLIIV